MPRHAAPPDPTLRPLPDYLRPGLEVVFVGINPGLLSAARGHYFANPRNPFWRLLHESGLTPVALGPQDDWRLPDFGYGLTDVVKRPSRRAADLAPREFRDGRSALEAKLLAAAPRVVCFNGRAGFAGYLGSAAAGAAFGRQTVRIGTSRVFVAPSTSPANAAVPLPAKRRYFVDIKAWLEELRQGTADGADRLADLIGREGDLADRPAHHVGRNRYGEERTEE